MSESIESIKSVVLIGAFIQSAQTGSCCHEQQSSLWTMMHAELSEQHLLGEILSFVETTKNRKFVEKIDGVFVFECPHCEGTVEVEEAAVACRIFRHASYKQPGNPPIPPHSSQDECERLMAANEIRGCAKPFMFFFADPKNYVEACDYI